MENIQQLRQERRNYKGAMHRAIDGLQQAMECQETHMDIIKELLIKVSNNYEKIEAVHAKLVEKLEDDDTFGKEEKWMLDVQDFFISVRLKTESFLKGQVRKNSESSHYRVATLPLENDIATVLPAGSRYIETWINLQNVNISRLIVELVEKYATSPQMESVKALLDSISYIGMSKVKLVSYIINGMLYCGMYLCNCHIPILPIIKKMIKGPLNDHERENIAAKYIKEIFDNDKCKDEIQGAYKKWKKARKTTIKQLRDTADDIEKSRKNANILKTAGSLTSATATAAYIAVALTPYGRFALAALAYFGGMAGTGADRAADELEKEAMTKSNEILDNQLKTTKDLLNLLDELKRNERTHLETAKNLDDLVVRFKQLNEGRVRVTFGIGDSIEEEIGFVQSFEEVPTSNLKHVETCMKVVSMGGQTFNLATAATKTVLNIPEDAVKPSLTTTEGVVKVVGTVASIAVIAIDVYTVVKTAIDLAEGSTVEAAANIRQVAQNLEDMKLPDPKDAISQSLLEIFEEFKIPVVQETN